MFAVQQALVGRFHVLSDLSRLEYATLPWLFGAALGFGVLAGDLVKSFFRRPVGVAPGEP